MLNITDIGINHRNFNVVKIKNKYNLVVIKGVAYVGGTISPIKMKIDKL